MSLLLFGRVLSFIIFGMGITWAAAWMLTHVSSWPVRFPRFVMSLHGGLFYGVYLTYFLHPELSFDLRVFSDWGSLYIMHIAWYLLFSQVEEDVELFSQKIPRWFYRQIAGGR